MYKDFKKNESLDTGLVGGNGIIWMFSGIILGLLVGLGMYYFTNNNYSPLSMVGTVQNKIKQAQSTQPKLANTPTKNLGTQHQVKKLDEAEQKPRQTKFSYYAVLPTLDVPVDAIKPIDTSRQAPVVTSNIQTKEVKQDNTPAAAVTAEITQKKQNTSRHGNYLLQVASYKNKSSARITRGRLSKKGIDAYIQEKKIKGKMWYRVVAGPVDQNSISSWKNSAERMGHRPLVISVR